MKTILAKDLFKAQLKTSFAQALVNDDDMDVLSFLRMFSAPEKPIVASKLPYFVLEDPDLNSATDINDVSNIASIKGDNNPYEFTLYDDEGGRTNYQFSVYRFEFKPAVKEINDSVVNVKGRSISLAGSEIQSLLMQGKADKFVAGVIKKDNLSEKFNYDMIGLNSPEAKKAFKDEFSDKTNSVQFENQVDQVRGDFQKYVSDLSKAVDKYNNDIVQKIQAKAPPPSAGAAGAAPPIAPPPAPMPI